MVEYLDARVGDVLKAIERNGQARNTLVVFMSDNGAEVRGGSNGPLRGLKRSVYEGGIRVPLIARFPSLIAPGAVNGRLGISMDLYATFAKLAGASLPEGVTIDGKDVMPMLAGRGDSPHENSPLFWAFGSQDAVRLGTWKLVREKEKPWMPGAQACAPRRQGGEDRLRGDECARGYNKCHLLPRARMTARRPRPALSGITTRTGTWTMRTAGSSNVASGVRHSSPTGLRRSGMKSPDVISRLL
jgi:arylsulfatase A-like enzyme